MCITCCFPRTYQKRSFWANLRANEWPLENKQISGGVLSFFFRLINKKLGGVSPCKNGLRRCHDAKKKIFVMVWQNNSLTSVVIYK